MKSVLAILSAWMALAAPSLQAQYIWVNLSFKAVLNPTNGTRYYNFTEADVDTTIDRINTVLGNYQRGYRFRRVEPIRNVGGVNDSTGPSKWYSQNPRATYPGGPRSDWTNQEQMETEALANQVLYAWNPAAVNYYITAGYGPPTQDAGTCAFPSAVHADSSVGTNYLITLGTVNDAHTVLHETGHFFQLYHTHNTELFLNLDGSGCGDGCNCPTLVPGDDADAVLNDPGLTDTALDHECFTSLDALANANYGISFNSLSPGARTRVENTFYNLMSYHSPLHTPIWTVLTELQLDKWSNYGNGRRSEVTTGQTRFVSLSGSNSGIGTNSFAPVRTVLYAHSVATADRDIVLLRPGNYNEQITLFKRLTFRATREGWATIGKP